MPFLRLAAALLLAASQDAAFALTPARLTCEHRPAPAGIDVPRPRLSWTLESATRGDAQAAYQILVASSTNMLALDRGDLWDSGRVPSPDSLDVAYSGVVPRSSQACYWKLRVWDKGGVPSAWSPVARWETGILNPADWQGARWIGSRLPATPGGPHVFSIRLRREFAVRQGLVHAVIHVCGLGQYALEANGSEITRDHLLTPGWTNYRKTCLYDTFDVTPALRQGPNALGLTLAGGMYDVPKSSRYAKFTGSFGPLRAIAVLRLEYADGTSESIVTDDRWHTGPSPVTFSSVYGGEDCDARLDTPGWSSAGWRESTGWAASTIMDGPGGTLRGTTAAAWPVRAIESGAAISSTALGMTARVYDFGQNAAMIPVITVHGPPGAFIRLIPSELSAQNGDISDPVCGRRSYCTFTLAGAGAESWSPRFYYRGARFLRVELSPAHPGGALPVVDSVTRVIFHGDAPPAGEFACSNDLFNRIHRLVRWAQRNNIVSILTDCPTREKLGWLEQTHLNGPALRYDFALSPLFAKITRDMAEAQTPGGLIPDIAPEYATFPGGFRDSPEWGSAALLVPWQQYEFDGDAGLLREGYEMMRRYVEYLHAGARGDIVDWGLGDWYDIGPRHPGAAQLTPRALTATAFYYQDSAILARVAAILGKAGDAARYGDLAARVSTAFNTRFLNAATGNYATGSQCANAVPLAMGLVPGELRSRVVGNIVASVERDGLTAGDVGYRYLLRALADNGRSDVILRLNNQSARPGYGMQLARGATSLTEAWDAAPGASQDHFMLGQINEWFFHDLAGIQPLTPGGYDKGGFRSILICPSPVEGITWAGANYDSVRGRISSWWKCAGGEFVLDVTIPAGSEAFVKLPTTGGSDVRESGLPLSRAPGATMQQPGGNGGDPLVKITSGSYHFTMPWPHRQPAAAVHPG